MYTSRGQLVIVLHEDADRERRGSWRWTGAVGEASGRRRDDEIKTMNQDIDVTCTAHR